MIFEKLEHLALEEQRKKTNPATLRNLLKEYLQAHILYFIYTSLLYQKRLVFTGGTCLRHFFDLPRLSEDLDFDFLEEMDHSKLKDDLLQFFKTRHRYTDLTIAIKQQGAQILLKFPVLHRLRLAEAHESDFLYVKVDLSPNPSSHYQLQTSPKNLHGLNFVARHYDLASLMSGKLHAILTRRHLKGRQDRETVKGRDYFDLLWYVQRGVKPNLPRLIDMLNEPDLTLPELENRIDARVHEAMTHHRNDIEADWVPLIGDPAIVKEFLNAYQEEYLRHKSKSFSLEGK